MYKKIYLFINLKNEDYFSFQSSLNCTLKHDFIEDTYYISKRTLSIWTNAKPFHLQRPPALLPTGDRSCHAVSTLMRNLKNKLENQ